MFGAIIGAVCAIGGAIASFVGSVGTAVASIGSAIGSAIAAVGPALSKFAKPVIECFKGLIARFPDLDIDRLKALIETTMKIVHTIMDILGINKHQMDQQEIGERALQNPEIKPEDYDTTEEYLDALHEGKYEKGKHPDGISGDAWKAMCQVVGTGLEVKAISEKMKMATPLTFFCDCAKAGLSAKDVIDGKGGGVLEKMRDNGVTDAMEFSKYVSADSCGRSMEAAMQGFVAPETGLTSAQMIENYTSNK